MDSSIWYAAADRGDRSNARAKAIVSELEGAILSDHILVETWTLLRRRLGREAADRFWEALRHGAATIESVTAPDLEVAWAIGEEYSDQDFSLVDRTSFAVMQRLGLDRVATFDDAFAVFRYGRRRNRFFTVLR